jgi:two-component system response regulator LytT
LKGEKNLKKIDTIIIDDDQNMIKTLEKLLSFYPFISVKQTFSRYLDAKQILDTKTIHLIFLDIMLEKENGIEIAELVHKQNENINIIFITSQPEFALEGYKAAPVDFITKPINATRLEQTLLRLKDNLQKKHPYSIEDIRIGIKIGNSVELIAIDTIIRLERKLRKVEITLKNNEKILCNESLKDLEEKLHRYGFISINRTLILPLKVIKKLQYDKYNKNYMIILHNDEKSIKISKEKFRSLKELLNEFEWII